ncbi:MAG: V-type ATPase subunit [Candidatus Micrarchaeota archaeon]|nr:V-type ATPase subunit [Candidatus Micrarchaeota archaeon]
MNERINAVCSSVIGALRSKLRFRPLIYGYSNARVRAMRTQLLSRRQAEDLLKVKSNAAVAEYLSRTGYRQDFAGLPPALNDEDRVEIAVSRNFARTASKLLRISPKQDRQALLAFLGRYDAHNIKTIILARKLGKKKEETEMLILPAGSITPKEISLMLSAKSPDQLLAEIRSTEFGQGFFSSKSIHQLQKSKLRSILQNPDEDGLQALLPALDSYYYEVAVSALAQIGKDSPLVARLIRSEIDAKNLMSAMRLKKAGADHKAIAKSMIAGGSLQSQKLEKLASAKGLDEIISQASEFFISETGKGEFAEAQKRFRQDGSLSHFEVVFEHSISRRSLHALRRSQMSLGAIIGFLLLKEEEMNNIRKIVRGKALGLSPEKIAELLVLVG